MPSKHDCVCVFVQRRSWAPPSVKYKELRTEAVWQNDTKYSCIFIYFYSFDLKNMENAWNFRVNLFCCCCFCFLILANSATMSLTVDSVFLLKFCGPILVFNNTEITGLWLWIHCCTKVLFISQVTHFYATFVKGIFLNFWQASFSTHPLL